MGRARRRAGGQAFVLYQAGEEMRPIDRCSRRHGEAMLAAGKVVPVVDIRGSHIGYQLKTRDLLNGNPSPQVATVISAREMDLVAGQVFRHGKSRTAGLPEAERLTRVTLLGKPLPAEDAIERAAAKLKYWTPTYAKAS